MKPRRFFTRAPLARPSLGVLTAAPQAPRPLDFIFTKGCALGDLFIEKRSFFKTQSGGRDPSGGLTKCLPLSCILL